MHTLQLCTESIKDLYETLRRGKELINIGHGASCEEIALNLNSGQTLSLPARWLQLSFSMCRQMCCIHDKKHSPQPPLPPSAI